MKIRQLNWKESNGDFVAKAFFGEYQIYKGFNGIGAVWHFGDTVTSIHPGIFFTPEQAKNACQIDFGNIVLSYIEDLIEIQSRELSHQRYEKLRKLNPRQFQELWSKNIETGIGVDDLVDALEA